MANDSKTWRCGKYELSFDRPRIMGVLNEIGRAHV